MFKPTRILGVDLTDSYARRPRPIDVAILDVATGGVTFDQFEYPPDRGAWRPTLADILHRLGGDQAIYVIDGPQALANEPNSTRDVEHLLRTPGRTPCVLPRPGARPFAGYVRSSVEYFDALIADGMRLADLDGNDRVTADLYETYPGAVWPLLHDRARGPLASKSVPAGIAQRLDILQRLGCGIDPALTTHDRLDAAICAVLGWAYHAAEGGNPADEQALPVALVGTPVHRDERGIRREGRMLMPARNLNRGTTLVHYEAPETTPNSRPAATPPIAAEPARPDDVGPDADAPHIVVPIDCDWVYFAGSGPASSTATYELIETFGLLVRTVHNSKGHLISRVQHIAPGSRVLLVYRNGAVCEPLALLSVSAPFHPVPRTYAIMMVNDAATIAHLDTLSHKKDPVLNAYTAFPVTVLRDLQGEPMIIPPPPNQTAIWPARYVAEQ